jgi:uncharacterized protein (TIGR00369 family)
MEKLILDKIAEYYIDLIPFNKVLGIDIQSLDYQSSQAITTFEMKDELIGNYTKGVLHGGVISSVIDLTGGLSALISCARFNEKKSLEEIQAQLTRATTIDMRVDYLRPGKGKSFQCKSRVIRAGRRIVVSKVDLSNDRNRRVAMGTATYLIG